MIFFVNILNKIDMIRILFLFGWRRMRQFWNCCLQNKNTKKEFWCQMCYLLEIFVVTLVFFFSIHTFKKNWGGSGSMILEDPFTTEYSDPTGSWFITLLETVHFNCFHRQLYGQHFKQFGNTKQAYCSAFVRCVL